MAATLAFHTLDVFTDTAYAGNPLAVVLGADGLDGVQMQRIAAEFNLSETVFVQQATQPGADARLRIFTPATELPFAGHPTIGTACLLAGLGASCSGDAAHLVLEENIGLVPVRLVREPGRPCFAELTAARAPEVRPVDFDPAALPAVLALEPQAIAQVRLASCGNPFVLVTLRQPEALAAIDFDARAARQLLRHSWAHALYVVARGYEGEWRARMFAPDLGVGEDPATGSAAVALAGALALEHADPDGAWHWPIVQGVEMGRPSQLHTHAEKRGGVVTAVRVGGHAVEISSGTLRLPG